MCVCACVHVCKGACVHGCQKCPLDKLLAAQIGIPGGQDAEVSLATELPSVSLGVISCKFNCYAGPRNSKS